MTCQHFKLERDPQRPWLWVCVDCLKRGTWKEEDEDSEGSVRIIDVPQGKGQFERIFKEQVGKHFHKVIDDWVKGENE